MKTKRNYGIELLRLVLMFMVCLLHTIRRGGIVGASESFNIGKGVYYALNVFAYCAVDSFAIISGYVANNKPKKYGRLVDIWLQVFFYSFIVTMIFMLTGLTGKMKVIDIIKCALPITYNKYWYMTGYFVLFLIMPMINKYIFDLDDKSAKKMFILTLFIFTIMGIMIDTFRTIGGYSPIWLIVLYCVGVLAKKIKLFEDKSTLLLIGFWFLCMFIDWGVYMHFGSNKLTSYISPTVVMSAIIMVILFSRIKIKGNIVSKLAPLSLGIYLFQTNQVIWDHVLQDTFIYLLSKNIFVGVSYVFLFASIIFVCGLIVEWIRQELAKKMKISVLSEKIANLINNILEKLFVFIK